MSKKPTGLTIARSGGTYTASWKCGDKNYDSGQQFQYSINGSAWSAGSVGAKARAGSIYINLAGYYPNTGSVLSTVSIRVRGKRKKRGSKWSAWTTGTYTNYVPNVPSLEASLDDQQTNKCTFTWNLVTDPADAQPYWHVRWETILVKESDVTDGSKLTWNSSQIGWETGAGSYASSVTMTEDTTLLANASYTRWFRVSARGARGGSTWTYAKHVYARPYQAKIEHAEISAAGAEGLTCFVQWVADQVPSHPIDHTTVQYLITVPNAGLTCPSGAQWTDAGISADTEGSDAIRFSIDDTLDKDECLFVRVNTVHDSNITYSAPALAAVGNLKDPTDLTYTLNNTDYTLTSASVDNNSDVPDSFIVLVYKAGSKPEEEIPIGIIVHGASQPLVTPVQCPDWSDEDAFSIGAYAAVGTYEATTDLGYTVNVKMRSETTIWVGGTVAIAPENVNVIQSAVSGTATVTWDWTWTRATHAQLSWTNHDDAWESTDEPEIYTINKSRATRWNISGLELGVKWYIAVRLVSGNPEDETAIYGPWSDAKDIVLSSVPNVPSLQLSSKVITVGEEINASWDFISNDGTAQKSAEICEVINGVYGKYFLSEDTSVITEENNIQLLNGKKYYTKSGSTYTLVPDSNKYSLTTDTAIDSSKTYYARSGSGTTLSPYVFTPVNSPVVADIATYYEITADPKTSEWYEFQQSIAHTSIEKEVVIDTEKLGWAEGEIHSLAVRVTSESNRTTDWSNPVSVIIAEALECEITSTSLVTETIEINPESFEKTDIVSFTTTQEETFAKLQADINPIQDLHGYDAPWVGGAGKNKVDLSTYLKTNNASVVASGNGVKITSTASVNNCFAVYQLPISLLGQTLTLSCDVTASSTNTPAVRVYFGNDSNNNVGTSLIKVSGTGHLESSATIPNALPENATKLILIAYCVAAPGTTGEGLYATFNNLQLEVGSTATAWQPYENICPISGHDEVGVSVCGKNLADYEYRNQSPSISTGAMVSYNSWNTDYIKVDNAKQYSLQIYNSTSNNYILFYDSNNTFLGYGGVAADTHYVISNNTYFTNTKYIKIRSDNGSGTDPQIMLEFGTTSSPYTAYNGQTYTTTLPSTTYGGTLDLVSGVLTVDRIKQIFTTTDGFGSGCGYLEFDEPIKKDASHPLICNYLAYSPNIYSSISDGEITNHGGLTVYAFAKIAGINDRASFETYITNNPIEVVAYLANLQTYQLTPQQIQTLVGKNNVWSKQGEVEGRIAEAARDVLSLTQMPLTVKLSGVNSNVTATVTIERTADYHMDRPDETQFDGYEGEIVFLTTQNSNEDIIINQEDLIGLMDDEAPYRIFVTFKDVYGQSMSDSVDFEVHWEHQAIIPEAEVIIDDENLIAKLTPIAPTGTLTGDTCDIYRLSADRPELIVKDAVFGTQYVDPYPAIGEFGGHRFVFKTVNGDYITATNDIAWTDTGIEEDDILDFDRTIIDFDGNQLLLYYNVDVGHQWDKDFQQTKYLGGSVQGDWNAGVSRSGSVSATMITLTDAEQIRMMRELAVYTGVCHVRTKDGSSYSADVQVSEDRDHDDYDKLVSFSLTITRVDTENLDGLTYEQWAQEEPDE